MAKTKKIFDIIPPQKVEAEKEEKVIEEIQKKKRTSFPFFRIGISILILLVLIGGGLHFEWSRVEIEIWPEIKTLNFDTKLTIDAKTDKPDFLVKVIPGKVFEEEKAISQNFPASGRVLKEERAQGTIRVYNNYRLPQTLITRTRFQPPLEKVLYFRTTRTITIPARSYLDVPVRADRPGEEYNIDPATFSIPGLVGTPRYYSIYGKSFSPMTGGFRGEVKQVTREDLEGAKKTLLKKLEDEGKDYLKTKVFEDFILLQEGTVQEVIETTSSVPENSYADSFDFNLKTKLKAILFKKSDLDNFAKDFVNLNLQETNKVQKELEVNYFPELVNLEIGKIVLSLKISAKVYSKIDISGIKDNVVGKSLRESQFFLGELQEIKRYQISPFPFWLKKIPENTERIKIKLRFD